MVLFDVSGVYYSFAIPNLHVHVLQIFIHQTARGYVFPAQFMEMKVSKELNSEHGRGNTLGE